MSPEIIQFSANETDDINVTGQHTVLPDRPSHRIHPYSCSPGKSQTMSHASSSVMSQDGLDSFIHGHSIRINPEDGTATLLMFMNPVVVNTHISHYYCDPKSPLWDESLWSYI
jgi:hypothetical protein